MSSQKNQSLIDGITCLQALAMASKPIGCRELARQLDMNVTRINRLLMTLELMGLASKDEKRKYLPGPGIHVLASQVLQASSFYGVALKVVSTAETSFTIALGLLWRDRVTYIYHSGGNGGESLVPRLRNYQATDSSIGRMLLAMKGADEIRQLYEGKEISGFSEGLTSLQHYLREVKQAGRVILPPLKNAKHYNVAVPIGKPAMAALALTGIPKESDVPQALEEIQQIKEELERQLG